MHQIVGRMIAVIAVLSALASCATTGHSTNAFERLVSAALSKPESTSSELLDIRVPHSDVPAARSAAKEMDSLFDAILGLNEYSTDACRDSPYEHLANIYGCHVAVALDVVRIRQGKEDIAAHVSAIQIWSDDRKSFPSEDACLNANRPTAEPLEVEVNGVYRRAWFNRVCSPNKIYLRDIGWMLPQEHSCRAQEQPAYVSFDAKESLKVCY